MPGEIDRNKLESRVTSNSIHISWDPPSKPNGDILKYIITISPPPQGITSSTMGADNNVGGESKPFRKSINLHIHMFILVVSNRNLVVSMLVPQCHVKPEITKKICFKILFIMLNFSKI